MDRGESEMTTKADRSKHIKKIEYYLRNYDFFKVGIKNMKEQLEFILPSCVTNYDVVGSTGIFNVSSTTEKYAIDRIESKRALDLNEEIAKYQLIIRSIDNAIEQLEEIEQKFIKERYFKKKTIRETAIELGYSEKHIFNLRNRVMTKLLISLNGLLKI